MKVLGTVEQETLYRLEVSQTEVDVIYALVAKTTSNGPTGLAAAATALYYGLKAITTKTASIDVNQHNAFDVVQGKGPDDS